MSRRLLSFLLFLQVFASLTARAEIFWQTDLNAARQRATSSSRRILIFFAAPGTSLSKYHEQLLSRPEVERELSASYELVRVDFAGSPELTRSLQVYRGGTLSLFSGDGTALGRIQRELPVGEFLTVLRAGRSFDVPGGSGASGYGQTTASATVEAALPASLSPSPPQSSPSSSSVIRKGALVSGPFDAHLRSSEPLPFGTLEKGRTYVLTISGRGSVWSGHTDGIDGLYVFRLDTKKGRIYPSRVIRVGGTKTPLVELVPRLGGSIPQYSPDHVYDVVVPGTGEPLNLALWDGGGELQADNSGSFRIALYEAEASAGVPSTAR